MSLLLTAPPTEHLSYRGCYSGGGELVDKALSPPDTSYLFLNYHAELLL